MLWSCLYTAGTSLPTTCWERCGLCDCENLPVKNGKGTWKDLHSNEKLLLVICIFLSEMTTTQNMYGILWSHWCSGEPGVGSASWDSWGRCVKPQLERYQILAGVSYQNVCAERYLLLKKRDKNHSEYFPGSYFLFVRWSWLLSVLRLHLVQCGWFCQNVSVTQPNPVLLNLSAFSSCSSWETYGVFMD